MLGGVAATVRENVMGASLNLSCVHMLMEGFSGMMPLQIQAPDHFKVNRGSSEKKKTHPFQEINGFEHKILASETGVRYQ